MGVKIPKILSVLAQKLFGTFLSFRVLKFPDLTVDGSFPLGLV